MDKASQPQAGYLGKEEGPFDCNHCEHFDGKSKCELVEGTVEPAGCCNLFSREASTTVRGAMKKLYARSSR